MLNRESGPGECPEEEDLAFAVADAGGPGSCDLVVLPEAVQADFGTGDPPPAAAAEPLDGPFS